ncbi:LicD family protein [Hungatella hathewayi]|uniref:LicD family protein n=1 Tax=Hungatella hathewayi TaxID=154046 RepID=UPI0035655435
MRTEKLIMPQKDLRKLQLIELEMLLEVDRICRENDIVYYLSAGTALGAVRHKGFIPWDDDLDVRMSRAEYQKFCKACEASLDRGRFFLQNDRTDPEYRWGYAKIRRKGTEYLREGQEAIRCMSGVSIDIFVIDNVPDSAFFSILYFIVRRACIKTLWSVIGASREPNPFKRLLYRGLRHINKRIPLSIMEWMAGLSNRNKTKAVVCTSFYRNDNYIKKNLRDLAAGTAARFFDDRAEIEFEGFLFYICKDFDGYLTDKYGDYWKYPPQEKRYLHPPKSYKLDAEIDLRGRSIEDYMNKEYLYLTKEERQGNDE